MPRTPSSSEHSLLEHIKPFIAFTFDFQFCLRDLAGKAGTRRAILPPRAHRTGAHASRPSITVCCDDYTQGPSDVNRSVCTQGGLVVSRSWYRERQLSLVRAQNYVYKARPHYQEPPTRSYPISMAIINARWHACAKLTVSLC